MVAKSVEREIEGLDDAVSALRPFLTAEFLAEWRRQGRKVGYRNLGRAIADASPVSPAVHIVPDDYKERAAKVEATAEVVAIASGRKPKTDTQRADARVSGAPRANNPVSGPKPLTLQSAVSQLAKLATDSRYKVAHLYDYMLIAGYGPDNARMVSMQATNLETYVSAEAPGRYNGKPVMVPAKALRDAIKGCPDPEFFCADGLTLTVKTTKGETVIKGRDIDDFPPSPAGDYQPYVTIPDFKATALRVALAAATDDSRPVLTGVNVRADSVMAASDGFRLRTVGADSAVRAKTWTATEKVIRDVTIPAKTIQYVADGCDLIHVNTSLTHAQFRSKTWTATIALVQGTFPNFYQLIPETAAATWRVKVNVRELADALATLKPLACRGAGIVRMRDDGQGRIMLAAQADDDKQDVTIDSEFAGPDSMKIAYNLAYMVDVCKAARSETVEILGTGPSSQMLILEGDSDAGPQISVLMPMFVQW